MRRAPVDPDEEARLRALIEEWLDEYVQERLDKVHTLTDERPTR